MDHFQQLRSQIRQLVFAVVIIENSLLVGLWWWSAEQGIRPNVFSAWLVVLLTIAMSIGLTLFLSHWFLQPVKAIWQAVLHLNPNDQGTAAPKTDKLQLGRELVTNLMSQIYQLNNVAQEVKTESTKAMHDLHHNFVAQNLPLPLIVIDPSDTISFANDAAGQYIGIASEDMIGKNVYMVLDMSFPTEQTFDSWLKDVKLKSATAATSWERVRLNVRDDHPPRLFDLAAYYNRDNPDHHETMLVMFDHTKEYSQDEQAVSFVALSVHELRTPLTLLKGYIEVFEDELEVSLTPELKDFMLKMRAMSEQLTAFVNNILNVARIDDDQLELKLQSESWGEILKSSIEMISLRAKVRGIRLECRIDHSLPPVGIDRLSIREVVNNLIDNAIKYSGNSQVIKIETHLNQEGLIETTVQDFGVGVPTSVVPNLFTKFYRDHRNRAQIGGTGLGLYLCKAIITAHGGSIWVRTQEGQGSTFGFTLVPYAQLAEEQKAGDPGITRSASGWIKNHSLYRR